MPILPQSVPTGPCVRVVLEVVEVKVPIGRNMAIPIHKLQDMGFSDLAKLGSYVTAKPSSGYRVVLFCQTPGETCPSQMVRVRLENGEEQEIETGRVTSVTPNPETARTFVSLEGKAIKEWGIVCIPFMAK